jgi:hypothetical protein
MGDGGEPWGDVVSTFGGMTAAMIVYLSLPPAHQNLFLLRRKRKLPSSGIRLGQQATMVCKCKNPTRRKVEPYARRVILEQYDVDCRVQV